MKKNVIISIKGTQVNDQGEKDGVEIVTEGTYYKKDDYFYILYKESEIVGMKGTTTCLKVKEQEIKLSRMGTTIYEQTFIEGENNAGMYQTPHGTFHMDIYTEKVEVNLDDFGGNLKMDYNLAINESNISKNALKINVREV